MKASSTFQSRMANNQNMEEYKLAVVGGGGVGKSAHCPIHSKHFRSTIQPLKTLTESKVDDKACFLEILDTAGQEEYTALRDQYMRTGDGFLLVYSVIDRKTFEEINDFYEQILRVKDADKVPMVLVGNKCDLESERVISNDEGKSLQRWTTVKDAVIPRTRDHVYAMLRPQVQQFCHDHNQRLSLTIAQSHDDDSTMM